MLGTTDGSFQIVPNYISGLYLNSNVRDASFIKVDGADYLIVISNKGRLNVFKLN